MTPSLQFDPTKAINYMLNQWQVLNYYCENGVAEMDNNIVENALHAVSLGDKKLLVWAPTAAVTELQPCTASSAYASLAT